MFDIGASELLLIVIVAIVVIGPKDLPLALRTAGRWIGKVRRMSSYFRSGIETMIREAEMEDMEKQWREQNARIMAEHPGEVKEGALPEKPAEVAAEPAAPKPKAKPRPRAKPKAPELPLDSTPGKE